MNTDVAQIFRAFVFTAYVVLGVTLLLRWAGYAAWATEPVLHAYFISLRAVLLTLTQAIQGFITLLFIIGSIVAIRFGAVDAAALIRLAGRARRSRTQ